MLKTCKFGAGCGVIFARLPRDGFCARVDRHLAWRGEESKLIGTVQYSTVLGAMITLNGRRSY